MELSTARPELSIAVGSIQEMAVVVRPRGRANDMGYGHCKIIGGVMSVKVADQDI